MHDYYNVVGILDQDGNMVERYGYSGFGDVRYMDATFTDRSSGRSAYGWDVLYKAQSCDDETGFYNYGYRYYSPLLGRWLKRDPMAEEGSDWIIGRFKSVYIVFKRSAEPQ